jgi:hypothetical protein
MSPFDKMNRRSPCGDFFPLPRVGQGEIGGAHVFAFVLQMTFEIADRACFYTGFTWAAEDME